ncbi:MAG: hypothetical protein ABTQ29_07490 [Siculibacillus sp.]
MGAVSRFGDEASAPFGVASAPLILHCPSGRVAALADVLRAHGADTVTVSKLDWIFAAGNEMADALDTALA